MKKVEIVFELSNAFFDSEGCIDESVLHQMMSDAADRILYQYYNLDEGEKKLLDENGNSVGTVKVTSA